MNQFLDAIAHQLSLYVLYATCLAKKQRLPKPLVWLGVVLHPWPPTTKVSTLPRGQPRHFDKDVDRYKQVICVANIYLHPKSLKVQHGNCYIKTSHSYTN